MTAEGIQDPGRLVGGAQAEKGLAGGLLSAAALEGSSLGEPLRQREIRGSAAQA